VSPRRQDRVKISAAGVKVVFEPLREHGGRIHTFVGFTGRSGSQEFEELFVADVLYVLLLVGGFVVLALCLRGLERL
jgi:hypothetical protein